MASNISNAKAKKEEVTLRLRQVGEELEVSKTNTAQLKGKLQSVGGQNEALEAEMMKLRVQTEQLEAQHGFNFELANTYSQYSRKPVKPHV